MLELGHLVALSNQTDNFECCVTDFAHLTHGSPVLWTPPQNHSSEKRLDRQPGHAGPAI